MKHTAPHRIFEMSQETMLTMSTEGGSGVEIELGAQPSAFEEFNSEQGNSHIRNNKSNASDAEGYVGVNKDQAKTTQEKAKDSADYRQQILDAKSQGEVGSIISESESQASNVSNVSQIGNRKKNRKKKIRNDDDEENCFDDGDEHGFGDQRSQNLDGGSEEEDRHLEVKKAEPGCCTIV